MKDIFLDDLALWVLLLFCAVGLVVIGLYPRNPYEVEVVLADPYVDRSYLDIIEDHRLILTGQILCGDITEGEVCGLTVRGNLEEIKGLQKDRRITTVDLLSIR